MKTILKISFLLLLGVRSTLLFAQEVKWQKAISSDGSAQESISHIVHDKSGNTFVQGYYSSPSFTFGGHELSGHRVINAQGAPGRSFFMAKFDSNDSMLWMKEFPVIDTITQLQPTGLTVDPFGNVVVTLLAKGLNMEAALVIGTDTVSADHPRGRGLHNSVFIVKMDPDGEVQWYKKMTGNGGVNWEVYADYEGNIIVKSGFTNGQNSIMLDTFTFTNPHPLGFAELLFIKLNADGDVLWHIPVGGKYTEFPYSVTLDHAGSIYFTAISSSDTIVFGDIKLVSDFGGGLIIPHQTIYGKIGPDGAFRWAKKVKLSPGTPFYGAVSNPDSENPAGTFFLSGMNNNAGPMEWSEFPLPKGGFYARLNSTGDPLWVKSFTDTVINSRINLVSMEFDSSDNLYILTTITSDTANIAGETIRNSGILTRDFVVVRINDEYIPSIYLSGGGAENESVVFNISQSGELRLAGSYASPTLSFGDIELTNSNFPTDDAFYAVYAKDRIVGAAREFPEGIFSLSPNPTAGFLRIRSNIGQADYAKVHISDITGVVLLKDTIRIENGATIDVSALGQGTYFITIEMERGVKTLKFIKT